MDDSFQTPAQWYDGLSAVRHEGQALWDGGSTLRLRDSAGEQEVPFADLVFAEQRGGELVYSRSSEADFRLILPEDLPAGLASHLPAKSTYGAWIDRLGLGKALVIFGLASAGAVALFMTAPEWLGPRIPESWERNLGQAMVGDMGNRLCHTPAGDAAMAKLLDAVDPAQVQVRSGVANIDMVNAVALPGGQVLLFDGLVQQAKSPEELAGVLGHEVGHVRERHVMTALLRQFGLSILLSGTNSSVGDTVFGLASMGYSREAEREADQFARARMAERDISPLGAAEFFERMGGDASGDGADNAVTGWIESHPSPGERAKAYRASARGKSFRPVLTPREFAAIKSMCKQDPDVEDWDLF